MQSAFLELIRRVTLGEILQQMVNADWLIKVINLPMHQEVYVMHTCTAVTGRKQTFALVPLSITITLITTRIFRITLMSSCYYAHDISSAFFASSYLLGWLDSRLVSVLDSGAEGPGFKSQSRRCRVTVLGRLFTPSVPLFTKQQNW